MRSFLFLSCALLPLAFACDARSPAPDGRDAGRAVRDAAVDGDAGGDDGGEPGAGPATDAGADAAVDPCPPGFRPQADEPCAVEGAECGYTCDPSGCGFCSGFAC